MVGGRPSGTAVDDLRLADLLAALSVATDLGTGNEPEKAIRSCLLATELARSMGLTETQSRDVYYTTMVLHLGCTAPSHELGHLFGDDVGVMSRGEHTDESTLGGSLAVLGLAGRGTGVRRVGHLARVVAAGKEGGATVLRSVCEVGTRLAERLHLGAGVVTALRDSTETWDGSSGAFGRAGDDIALPARLALVATQAVIFDRLGGPDAALGVVRERAGHWFDPAVAAVFLRAGPDLLRRLGEADVWAEVLEAEPAPVRRVPVTGLDDVAGVFADMVDLKSRFTLGHSTGVAELAATAAARLGWPTDRQAVVRRAGLLHDIGRVAVSVGVWERPRALSSTQWELVRLHPYHSERILARSPVLADLAPIAGMHHERSDGSGYHHAVAGAAIPVESRLLAAADAFEAMTQDRPHRPARSGEEAAAQLEVEASSGGLDVECARAVAAAAGQRTPRRGGPWPAGLTDREVEVLRLLAHGSTNRRIAAELVISPRTAEHHVQHIYTKIGGSTRAAAALFAAEHGLLHRPA
jgi:HD-GYP domain-containing protein (c-di-GMP phosphodiesterase class II)